jgi:hypothetical protein
VALELSGDLTAGLGDGWAVLGVFVALDPFFAARCCLTYSRIFWISEYVLLLTRFNLAAEKHLVFENSAVAKFAIE